MNIAILLSISLLQPFKYTPYVVPLQAFTLEQLSVWEPGGGLRSWLEGVEVCAAQFCALGRQENHELTELLQNYWRCRRQLTQSHTQLHTQSSDCKSTQNRLWTFRDEQLTLQVFFFLFFFSSSFFDLVMKNVQYQKLLWASVEMVFICFLFVCFLNPIGCVCRPV